MILEVPEIPSSGYLWQPTTVMPILNLMRDEFRAVSNEALGGNGLHRFVFSVMQSGEQRIRLELARPWQSGMAVEVRNVDVVAQPRPMSGVVNPNVLIGSVA